MKKSILCLVTWVLICLLVSCSGGVSKTPISESTAKALLEKQYGKDYGISILGIYVESDNKSHVFAHNAKENNQHDYLMIKLADGRWVLAPNRSSLSGTEIADNIKKGYVIK